MERSRRAGISGTVIQVVRWLPVLLVAILVSFVYGVHLRWFVIPVVGRSPVLGTTNAIVFHCLMGLLVWAYIQCVRVHPGRVPEDWSVDNLQVDVDVTTLRACAVCKVYKPPRAHHCSQCNECILLFDHHCPWINNCVGLRNRKHFLLFLLYTPVTALWICLTSYQKFTLFNPEAPQEDVLFNMMFLLVAILGIALGLFFSGSFCLAVNDQTTIDVVAGVPRTIHGAWLYNLRSICGPTWCWFLPLTPPDDPFLSPTEMPSDDPV
eukprot:GGOE01041694.1.p2 GENE.GGOE01041694.1~~GGOE01041694.1.p2  ORF type:complete len:265 (-),score=78.08 GGOE01041694.1:184-978(-)